MSALFTTVASVLFATSAFASHATVPLQISLAEWQPQVGDHLLLDTKDNWGYMMHDNGLYIRFPIATGQRRNVWYIGRYYNAATPNWNWELKSESIKGDRVTFGPTGRFLRLYKDGDTRTPYGIHGHRDADEMMESDERFRSMGCVIVKEDMLDLIEQTYELNGELLDVQTVYGNPFTVLVSKTLIDTAN
ncbi:hypothetical protein COU76_05070 [Candidatus Peregrinibacteria bacterium CG10_big_fil_rev_8_21_14_0_10_49_10]|nr:MAG: hypothetical protein COU76_05070 [Candidatus Peregrinibacteria bacterium CG10_big_fil_rev_8_21_14_0_10_49_10]